MNKKQRTINNIKNGGYFLLLISLLLITSACRYNFEPPMMEMPAEGQGYFSLVFDDRDAVRTIVPTTVKNDFAAYKLEFFSAGTTIAPVTTAERTNATLSNPVLLNVGTWDLCVSAYMDVEKTKLAARGYLLGIEIGSGITTGSAELLPIIDSGEGTFKWDISYPSNVNNASMTITPLDAENGTPERIHFFTGGTPTIAKIASLTLKIGFYRVVFKLTNTAGLRAERRETLHVYRNIESPFVCTFENEQFTNSIIVTSNADSGPGSLRQAINETPTGGIIVIDSSVETIMLTSRLPNITKNITIEGNGVIITRDASWTTVSNISQLMYVGNGGTVTVRRIHFKDGRATTNGAAIDNRGSLTLESCILSGNSTSDSSSLGGAVYNPGTISVIDCTFYRNTAFRGGAICVNSGTLTLTGNLFYGNTATSGPVVYRSGGTVTSNGYNVVDVALGAGTAQSGWEDGTGDKVISGSQVSPLNFKLLSGNQIANVITTLPAGYPSEDFYGNPITNNAAAGAVQSTANGYYIDLSVNDSARGIASIAQTPNSDGNYTGQATITAIPSSGWYAVYWFKDGINIGNTNPLTITLTDHTVIRAVFCYIVNNFTDVSGSETIPGTLRHALTNAISEEHIVLDGVTPGQTTIELTSRLPDITKNITIEGNGVIITRDASWTTVGASMNISDSGIANISRIHFRGQKNQDGGAIYSKNGTFTLESCIFSGNIATGFGGAVCNTNGTLSIKACTFYGNRANYGGAIHKNSGNLTLAGNIFFENTANSRPVLNRVSITLSNNGYNVVDVAFGTGTTQSGWEAHSSDRTIEQLFGNNTTLLFVDYTEFRPVSGLGLVIDTAPADFPITDFYGNVRSFPGAPGAVAW